MGDYNVLFVEDGGGMYLVSFHTPRSFIETDFFVGDCPLLQYCRGVLARSIFYKTR